MRQGTTGSWRAAFGWGALWALLILPTTFASERCSVERTADELKALFDVEYSPQSPFALIEPAQSARLPDDMVRAVRVRSFAGLPEQSEGGKDVVFKVYGYHPDGKLKKAWLGESIQASFVVKVLREKFPMAKFVPNQRHGVDSYPGHREVSIGIGDAAEIGHRFGRRGPTSLEMVILKNANPGLTAVAPLVRDRLRNSLGLRDSDFVLSLYLKSSNYLGWERSHLTRAAQNANPSIRQIVGAASAIAQPRAIFLSAGGSAARGAVEDLMQEIPAGYELTYLSELSAGMFTRKRRYFVVNDLEGRVPHVHAVADLAVIAGPINSVEALQSGAPTVIIANERLRETYEISAYRLLNQTSAKRGAVIASGIAQLEMAMRTAKLHWRDPQIQEQARAAQERTTADFLDHLEAVVSSAWSSSSVTAGDPKSKPTTLKSFQ